MNDQRPMTRRERRERERAAERAAHEAAVRREAAMTGAHTQHSDPTPDSQAMPDAATQLPVIALACATASTTEKAVVESVPEPTPQVAPEPAPEPLVVHTDTRRAVNHHHPVLHVLDRSGVRGLAQRGALLTLLATVTILVPLAHGALGINPPTDPRNNAADHQELSQVVGEAPVAAAVLANDVDIPEDAEAISNVPDAATRARIREAYENAAVTCAPANTGASGDTAAFTTTPDVFYPMLPGTYSMSSDYGWRIHPTMGYSKFHAGQDMAAPAGTPIHAAAAGTVVEAGMVDGTGTVTIEHEIDGHVWYTSYLHMYADGIYVHVGDTVSAGQLIAGVGSTGYSTGAHLHFEVRTKNDSADSSTVDPMNWLREHHAVNLTTDCS